MKKGGKAAKRMGRKKRNSDDDDNDDHDDHDEDLADSVDEETELGKDEDDYKPTKSKTKTNHTKTPAKPDKIIKATGEAKAGKLMRSAVLQAEKADKAKSGKRNAKGTKLESSANKEMPTDTEFEN